MYPNRLKLTRPPRIPALLLATLLACGTLPAAALADQPSAKLCLNETSTPGAQACMHRALDEADLKLNAAYKKAMSVIDQDDRQQDPKEKANWKAQLAGAQRVWMAFRDADCGDLTFSEWNNGSGTTAALYACRYDKTVQRTAEILSRYPLE